MLLIHFLLNPATAKLIMLIACGTWVLRDERDKNRQVLFVALVVGMLYQGIYATFMAAANSQFHWKYDYYLLSLDRALGISADRVALALLVGAWPAILKVTYHLMLPAMI